MFIKLLAIGLEPIILKETDFKSVVSTNFTKRVYLLGMNLKDFIFYQDYLT